MRPSTVGVQQVTATAKGWRQQCVGATRMSEPAGMDDKAPSPVGINVWTDRLHTTGFTH